MQTDKQTEELFSQAESFSNSKVGRAGWALIICQLSLFPSKWHRIVAIMAVVLSSSAAWAQTTQIFNSSGTFTCPAGVTTLTVECWGGGGAGGSARASAGSSGSIVTGGGAGGAYAKKSSIPVTPNTTYTVTVGLGGTAPTTTTYTDGSTSDGADSSFTGDSSMTVTAKGGQGAQNRNVARPATGAKGAPVSGSIGDTTFLGGNGANGASTPVTGAGGGSAGRSRRSRAGRCRL